MEEVDVSMKPSKASKKSVKRYIQNGEQQRKKRADMGIEHRLRCWECCRFVTMLAWKGFAHSMPESAKALWRMVSLTAAKTSRMFEVSVACVRLEVEDHGVSNVFPMAPAPNLRAIRGIGPFASKSQPNVCRPSASTRSAAWAE